MKNFRSRLAPLFCALFLSFGAGQAPAPLTADQVIAKNVEAKGGAELLKATDTVKWSGRITAPTGTLTMTVWAKRPDRKRTEAERDGQKRIEAFDGQNGWVKMGPLPAQAVPPGPALQNAKRQAAFDSGLLTYKEQGLRVELVGSGPVDGAYHLRVTPKDGPQTHYYIDAKTGLERRVVTELPTGSGTPAVLEMQFSDYRNVDGRMVPFAVETVVDGKSMSKTTIESMEFNIPIDDAFFRMPVR